MNAAQTPLLLRALACEATERAPVWLYRQAGRFLPEYRQLRSRCDFATLCATPELAAEATLQPIRRYPLDASIVFSDLLVPFEGLGLKLEYTDRGPAVKNPPRTAADWDRLPAFQENEAVTAPARTLEILRRELPEHVTRIGFSGSPWTLALYLVQGRGSKDFVVGRAAALQEPVAFRRLLEHLAEAVAEYLALQVAGGAQVVQLFDSWAGLASPALYREVALPAVRHLVQRFRERAPGVPVVWFVRGSQEVAQLVTEANMDGVAVDFTVDLPRFAAACPDVAVQGNLDPAWLLAEPAAAASVTRGLLNAMEGRPGYVFNLGHGITPDSRPETVAAVIETVVQYGSVNAEVAR